MYLYVLLSFIFMKYYSSTNIKYKGYLINSKQRLEPIETVRKYLILKERNTCV